MHALLMNVVGMKVKVIFGQSVCIDVYGNVFVPSLGCLHLPGQFVSPVRVCSFCLLRYIPEE